MDDYLQLVGKDKCSIERDNQHKQAPLDDLADKYRATPCSSLVATWWNEAAWPGMGLFGESYLLFSIGLIKPFWQILYPDCFSYEVCSPRLLDSLTYSVVLGVICGMIVLGYSANKIGRRTGGILTASVMSAGAIGLTSISFIFAKNPGPLFRSMSMLLFAFGFGVGGEYPLSSATATENAMGEMKRKLRLELERETRLSEASALSTSDASGHPTFHLDVSGGHCQDADESSQDHKRGQAVQLVFLSQGIGIMTNSLCLVVLLLLFGQYGAKVEGGNYSPEALLAIWRIGKQQTRDIPPCSHQHQLYQTDSLPSSLFDWCSSFDFCFIVQIGLS